MGEEDLRDSINYPHFTRKTHLQFREMSGLAHFNGDDGPYELNPGPLNLFINILYLSTDQDRRLQ